MSPTDQLIAYAQSIYLVIKNRYFDDITGPDGQVYLSQVVDWTTMFLDEIENEVNPDGTPIDWKWVEQLGFTLGTATAGDASITLDNTINNVIVGENRYVQILQDGTAVSNWLVVAPDDISTTTNRNTQDMVTLVGGNVLTFSRAFKDTEDGGTIIGDITTPFPRMVVSTVGGVLTATNVKILSVIKPKTLLILGVAKNATLPDIVQGGLSPSYVQKYGDLLNNAIARNTISGSADTVVRDDYSSIGGVY